MKSIRFGLVGCGKIAACNHAPEVAHLGRNKGEIVALYDIKKGKAAAFAREANLPNARICRSYAELLAADIDAVIIATPNSFHYPQTLAALKDRLDDKGIQASIVQGMDPSRVSETKGYGWDKLTSAIAQTWPEALISPYLMVACSDSRHYCAISDYVYRFSAMALTKQERGCIHGHDERIPVDKIVTTVQFYVRLMRSL